jgi:hypothetical protein
MIECLASIITVVATIRQDPSPIATLDVLPNHNQITSHLQCPCAKNTSITPKSLAAYSCSVELSHNEAEKWHCVLFIPISSSTTPSISSSSPPQSTSLSDVLPPMCPAAAMSQWLFSSPIPSICNSPSLLAVRIVQ